MCIYILFFKYNVLSKFTNLYCTTFVTILSHMRPMGYTWPTLVGLSTNTINITPTS